MYYKYRSLKNLQFILDILVNQRLYASKFMDLNDPMEGMFTYGENEIPDWILKVIASEKNNMKILSLCEAPNNMLMWSHYSDGHSGIVLGVELADSALNIDPIEYVDDFNLNINQDDIAKALLVRKHAAWRYEKEIRVFVKKKSFVSIVVKELIFGIKTDNEIKNLITSVAKIFNPEVEIKTMTEILLNKGSGSIHF